MSDQDQRLYEFGPFRLIPAERLLLRDGQTVALAPKDFEVLVALVRRSGHLVEKDELLKEVWPDSFVEEANLSRHVYALRRALGADEAGREYIETVPKRGYRFALGVQVIAFETVTRTRIVAEEEITIDEPDALNARAGAPPAIRQPNIERDTIVLADFENRTGDDVFDGTLKQGLAVQMEQSPFLTIYSDQRVREALRYMGRAPDERVTNELAREVCERQGLKVLITGSIASLGSHYVITLEALNGQTGESIARAQVEAESKERVLNALGEAAARLRGKMGESLASVQKFDAPIEQATTSSLAALKAFSLGSERPDKGKRLEAIPFFKRAIEIDPNFALAYARLAIIYSNTSQPELAAQVAQKAFELRGRVSERERLYISYTYYSNVTHEPDKAIEELEMWTRTYPSDAKPHSLLAFLYINTRQFEKAVEEARESIRLDPNAPAAYSNLGAALVCLNRFDEAEAVCHQFLARELDQANIHEGLFFLAFRKRDAAGMQRQIEWMSGRRDEHLSQKWQAIAAAHQGQLRKATELFDRGVEMAQQKKLKEPAAKLLSTSVVNSALFGDCRETEERASKALALARNSDTVWNSALALSLCGRDGAAQSLIDDYAGPYPQDTRPPALWTPIIRAVAALRNDNAARAIDLLRLSVPYGGQNFWWPEYFRGLAYLRERKPLQAGAEFQKILGQGWSIASPLTAPAHVGLARAAALAGDAARSRKAYEDFFALWKDADPDIPILQQARREYGRL